MVSLTMPSTRKLFFLVALFSLAGCNNQHHDQTFVDEISELQDYFHIPGVSFIVTKGDSTRIEGYLGYSDLVDETPMDSVTAIPMASLTKMFSGYLVAQQSNRGILNRPINTYVTDQNIPDSILVKHVLSHTSAGSVGKHFHYSNRFSWLTQVIEKENDAKFEVMINSQIVVPNEMNHTFLLQNKEQVEKRGIAMPYVFEGETKPGFIDYGFSASAGITSTVRDFAKFSRMISHTMVENERAPFDHYNWGLFGQDIQGVKVLWAYGQYDCYSSLFLKVPEKDLTFIIAGNNSLIADPARLIYGDITTSLFALSFLEHFVNLELPGETLKAKALAGSFMGRFDPDAAKESKELLREVFKRDSNYYSLATMHTIASLKEIAAN